MHEHVIRLLFGQHLNELSIRELTEIEFKVTLTCTPSIRMQLRYSFSADYRFNLADAVTFPQLSSRLAQSGAIPRRLFHPISFPSVMENRTT